MYKENDRSCEQLLGKISTPSTPWNQHERHKTISLSAKKLQPYDNSSFTLLVISFGARRILSPVARTFISTLLLARFFSPTIT